MLSVTSCCRTCMKDNTTVVDLFEPVMMDQTIVVLSDALTECTGMEVKHFTSIIIL